MDGRSVAFLEGFAVLRIPVLVDGIPVWIGKFPMDKIEAIRKTGGEKKFKSQMMLEAVDQTDGRFAEKDLQFYDAEIDRAERNNMLIFSLCGKKLAGYSCWWDPSLGIEGGDNSVIALIYTDEEGSHYLHDIEYLSVSSAESSATEQCVLVAGFIARHCLGIVHVEDNGLGKFLPEILGAHTAATVRRENSKTAKSARILSAFGVITSAGMLFVHERVRNSRWLAEFVEWTPEGSGHDDGLDASAGAIRAIKDAMPRTSLVRRKLSATARPRLRWE